MAPGNTDNITGSVIGALAGVTTATLTTLLLKKGLRSIWMRGTRPLQPGQPRVVGERLHAALRAAPRGLGHAGIVEFAEVHPCGAIPAGCIAVVDAMGCTDAGIFGDILCARIRRRGGGRAGYRRSGARRRRRRGHTPISIGSGTVSVTVHGVFELR